MLFCAVDPSPLITGGCPEKSLPAGGICACAKWTWNMPRWITESPSAPLAVPTWQPQREKEEGVVGNKNLLNSESSAPLPALWGIYHLLPSTPFCFGFSLHSKCISCSRCLFFPPSFLHALCTSPSLEQAVIIDGEKRKNKLLSLHR